MTAPSYGIRLVIDATGSKAGRDVHVRSIEEIKRANAGLGASQRTVARDLQATAANYRELQAAARRMTEIQEQAAARSTAISARLARELQFGQANIREALARGLISPTEAQRQGQAAGQAFNRGLLLEIERIGGAGGFRGAQGQALYTSLAGQLQQVDRAAATAGRGGLRTITSQLAILTAQSLGVRSGIGGMASALGALSLGALGSLGVIAGLSAVVGLYRAMTRESREAAEKAKALRERLLEAATATDFLRRRQAEQEAEQARLAAEDAVRRLARAAEARQGAAGVAGGGGDQLRNLVQREYNDALEEANDKAKQLQGALNQLEPYREADAEATRRQTEEAERLREARTKELQQFQDLARARDLLRAQLTRDPAAIGRAVAVQRLAEIDARVRAAEHLTAAEQEQLRAALKRNLLLQTALEQTQRIREESEAIRRITDRTLVLKSAPFTSDAREAGFRDPRTGRPVGESDPEARARIRREIEAAEQARQNEIRALADSRRAILGFVDGLLGLPPALGEALAAVIRFQELAAIDPSKIRTSDKLLTGATIGLAAGQLTGSALGGGLIGAAGGFAVGGPLGAIAGGVAGFVSGLFSSAQKAEQAAERMRQATRTWERAFEDFFNVVNPQTPLQQSLQNIQRQYEDLVQNAVERLFAAGLNIRGGVQLHGAGQPLTQPLDLTPEELRQLAQRYRDPAIKDALLDWAEAAELLAPALERARQEFARLQQQFNEDLGVRELRARGLTAEADAQQLLLDQQRERFEAERAGYDAATLARLDYIHGLETEAFNLKQVADAIARVVELEQNEFSLRERELRLLGLDRDAAEVRAEAERHRQIAEAQRQLAAGEITQEFFTRLFNVIEGEFQETLANIEDQEDAPGISLAVGVAESTVQRLIGIQQSQLVHTAYLPLIHQVLQAIDARGGAGLAPGGLTDVGQGSLIDQAQLASGQPPSNLN